jgi:hypothetical protein
MDFIGEIISEPDPPGINKELWAKLIDDHPCLERFPSAKEGINPFTRKPMIYRSKDPGAWVVVDGRKVGRMDWPQNGSNCILVSGERDPVVPLAHNIAEMLRGHFKEQQPD